MYVMKKLIFLHHNKIQKDNSDDLIFAHLNYFIFNLLSFTDSLTLTLNYSNLWQSDFFSYHFYIDNFIHFNSLFSNIWYFLINYNIKVTSFSQTGLAPAISMEMSYIQQKKVTSSIIFWKLHTLT